MLPMENFRLLKRFSENGCENSVGKGFEGGFRDGDETEMVDAKHIPIENGSGAEEIPKDGKNRRSSGKSRIKARESMMRSRWVLDGSRRHTTYLLLKRGWAGLLKRQGQRLRRIPLQFQESWNLFLDRHWSWARVAQVGFWEYGLSARPHFLHRQIKRVLLLPGDDPGSLGDDAMMQATLTTLRAMGVTQFGVAKGSVARKDLSDYGADVIQERLWDDLSSFVSILRRYQALYVFGADVMDGDYSESLSCNRLLWLHWAHHLGFQAVLLGFSFNNKPTARIIQYFQHVNQKVSISLRDGQSLTRFSVATGRCATQSADVAFLLVPSGSTPALRPSLDWMQEQRMAGRDIIGININPLLLSQNAANYREIFLDSMSRLLEFLANNPRFRFLLLPHDYRLVVGDEQFLARLKELLHGDVQEKTRLVEEHLTSAEVKELCGSLYAAISGRMHLCIACLGRGVPALGIDYQDKFEGLMEHFHDDYLPVLEVTECLDSTRLIEAATVFLEKHDTLKSQIDSHLQTVEKAARKNFPGLG